MTAALVGILTFIIGAIVGFFAQRLLTSTPDENALQAKITQRENDLTQYKQEVAEHLEASAALLSQMNSTCQTAMQQMAQSTKLLQQATPKVTHMPFFAEETQQQLTATATERHALRKTKNSNEADSLAQPPLDYSSNSSGLFADQKQSVTNPE